MQINQVARLVHAVAGLIGTNSKPRRGEMAG
jgi:hypothetical protein